MVTKSHVKPKTNKRGPMSIKFLKINTLWFQPKHVLGIGIEVELQPLTKQNIFMEESLKLIEISLTTIIIIMLGE